MQQWQDIELQAGLAASAAELRKLRDKVHDAIGIGASTTAEGFGAAEIVNRLHDAFIRRVLAMTEERVRTSYPGVPPVSSFVVMLFGSGGRREQTLWSDQDNGLVYETAPGADAAEADRYAAELGAAFEAALEAIGYPPCEGGVLVTNPLWRKTLADWRRTLDEWFDHPEFETVRRMLIIADGRPICGDERLAAALQSELAGRIEANRGTILPRMLQNTLRYKVLVGLFGNLLREPYGEDAGGIDIKYGAYLPLVNAIRLLALSERVYATSTFERIDGLREAGIVTLEAARQWEEAFRTVIKFRAMTPFQIVDGKYTTSGILPAKALTKQVKRELKDALRVGAELQRRLKRTFGTEGHL